MKGNNKKTRNKKTRNIKTRNKRHNRKDTRKNNKKGRGIFKKLFRKDLRESLISKKSRKEEQFAEMSHKELIKSIEMLLEEAEKVEQLEDLLNVYRDFFDKDNIISLLAGLQEAMHCQNQFGQKDKIKIKTEYHELFRKLQNLLELLEDIF